MADKPLTKLEKLLISEVSAVDDPASEIPGWMVQKSRRAEVSLVDAVTGETTPTVTAALVKTNPSADARILAGRALDGNDRAADALRAAVGDDEFVRTVRYTKSLRASGEELMAMFVADSPVTRSAIEQGSGVPTDNEYPQNAKPHHSQAQPRSGGKFKARLFKPAVPKPKLGGKFF